MLSTNINLGAVSKKVTLNSGSKQQDIKLSQLSLYNENSVVGRSVKIISNEISWVYLKTTL